MNISKVEQLADTLENRHAHSCCWLGENSIVITGGWHKEPVAFDKCEMYDCAKNEWQELPDLNQPIARHSSSSFNSNTVYIFCG